MKDELLPNIALVPGTLLFFSMCLIKWLNWQIFRQISEFVLVLSAVSILLLPMHTERALSNCFSYSIVVTDGTCTDQGYFENLKVIVATNNNLVRTCLPHID